MHRRAEGTCAEDSPFVSLLGCTSSPRSSSLWVWIFAMLTASFGRSARTILKPVASQSGKEALLGPVPVCVQVDVVGRKAQACIACSLPADPKGMPAVVGFCCTDL
eukprot:365823-Chlamydomonas_euryale.AAC.4